MSEEVDAEILPEETEEPERDYYVDKIKLEELRRYVCLDLARMCEPMAKDVVKIARDMESFLLGKGPRAVE